MTESQEKHLKFLKGVKAKLFQEEDWKNAAAMSSQIEMYEKEIRCFEQAEKEKRESPLR